MNIHELLEDFGAKSKPGMSGQSEEDVEVRRLEAFEEGYQAGWDDSVEAHSKDRRQISTDLGQNLLDLSFTYNEAYAHLAKGLQPLLTDVVNKVLPEIMQASIGHRVVEELLKATRNAQTKSEVVVLTAAENLDAVEALLDQEFSFPLSVREDGALGPGQVQITFEDREIELNLDAMIADIRAAVEAFSHEIEKGQPNERREAV